MCNDKTFLFINLSIGSGYYGVNHGIAYLVPVVRKNSFQVKALHLTKDISENGFKELIEDMNPLIIGYSCTSLQLKYLSKYSNVLKDFSNIIQIAGGVGPTLDPEGFLLNSDIDGVVIGEGEGPLADMLMKFNNNADIVNTKGFYWKNDGEIVKNEIPQFIIDLSKVDYPDYSVFPKDVIQITSQLNLSISRGCPYSCHYCSNRAIRNVYPSSKHYFRVPPVEYCIELIERQMEQYPKTNYINFEDDLLIANKNWFLSFAKEYYERLNIPYRIPVRTECVDEDICKALRDSGCDAAYLGLESGNEAFRINILNRHYTNTELKIKSKMIRNTGIKLFTFNMVGLPFETKEHLEDTLKLNKEIKTDFGACTFFYPFPQTELYKICENEKLLDKENLDTAVSNYNTTPIINMSQRHKNDCVKTRKKLLNYFAWRELRYEYNKFRANHSINKSFLNLIRLFMIYLLKRFSSPFKQGSMYRKVMDSRFRIRIWQIVRKITN